MGIMRGYPQTFTGLNHRTLNHRHGKRLQGATDVRHRARRRTDVLQVPGNAAGGVPCERLRVSACPWSQQLLYCGPLRITAQNFSPAALVRDRFMVFRVLKQSPYLVLCSLGG